MKRPVPFAGLTVSSQRGRWAQAPVKAAGAVVALVGAGCPAGPEKMSTPLWGLPIPRGRVAPGTVLALIPRTATMSSSHVVKGLCGCDGAGTGDGELVLDHSGAQCTRNGPAKRERRVRGRKETPGGSKRGVVGKGPRA